MSMLHLSIPGAALHRPKAALASAAAAHVALFGLLLTPDVSERIVKNAAPLAVRLIDLPPPAMPTPAPAPTAVPVRREVLPPPTATSRPLPTPSPVPVTPAVAAVTPTTAPEIPVAVAAPASSSATPSPAAPALAPQATAVAITPARFDAAYLENPKPAYPPASRRLGEEGRVVLHVEVSAEGLAKGVEVRQSSGFSRLDAAARDAVARWKFVPAQRGQTPVTATVLVPIVFNLES